jgi:hypothetical protein
MRRLTLSLAFAASAIAMASMQANGSYTSSPKIIPARDARACKVLVKRMERSPSANTWRNRILTWKCRHDLSHETPETTALIREMDQ